MHESEEIATQPYPQQWLRPEMKASWLAILNHRREKRGIMLAPWQTRAIRRGDIHEIITTSQVGSVMQGQIDEVYYLGFAEFESGILAVGDDMLDDKGTSLGQVIGFDEMHAPNHLNILLTSSHRLPGIQLGLQPGMTLLIRKHA